jgi:hypothetical protein
MASKPAGAKAMAGKAVGAEAIATKAAYAEAMAAKEKRGTTAVVPLYYLLK